MAETTQLLSTQEDAALSTETAGASKAKNPKKPKKKRRKLIISLVVVLVIVGFFGYNMYKAASYVPSVRAGTASYQDLSTYFSTTATITTPDSTHYFAPPNSKVLEVNFKLGDTVKEGDVIATFDLTDLNDQVRLAQIQLSNAQLALKDAEENAARQPEIDAINAEIQEYNEAIIGYQHRIQKIKREWEGESDSGYVPDEEDSEAINRYTNRIENYSQEISILQSQLSSYPKADSLQRAVENAKNTVETASINLRSLQKYQADKGLVAEHDGVISQMDLVEGALASNAAPAVVVNNTDELLATFKIGKYDVGNLKVGQEAVLSLGNLKYHGVVSKIASAAVTTTSGTSSSTQVPAEITIRDPDEHLILGLEFDVDINTYSQSNVLCVPVEAVLTDRGGDFAYKLVPTEKAGIYTFEKAYLTTGNSSESYIEVLSGISEGDALIMSPPTTIEMLPIVQATGLTPVPGASGSASEPAASSEAGEPEPSQEGEPSASSDAPESPAA